MSISSLIPLAAPVLNVAANTIARIGQQRPFADFLAEALQGNQSSQQKNPADDIRLPAELAGRLEELAQRICKHLEANGIDTSRTLELSSDGFQIRVENDHSQSIDIEQVLAGDSTLQSQFQQLAEQLALVAGDSNTMHDVAIAVSHTDSGIEATFRSLR